MTTCPPPPWRRWKQSIRFVTLKTPSLSWGWIAPTRFAYLVMTIVKKQRAIGLVIRPPITAVTKTPESNGSGDLYFIGVNLILLKRIHPGSPW